jgi:hypothetical protein
VDGSPNSRSTWHPYLERSSSWSKLKAEQITSSYKKGRRNSISLDVLCTEDVRKDRGCTVKHTQNRARRRKYENTARSDRLRALDSSALQQEEHELKEGMMLGTDREEKYREYI